MAVCGNCGETLREGALFCGKCGTRVESVRPSAPTGNPSAIRTLTISREQQFQCMANTYKVIVNGNNLGNIGMGRSLNISLATDTATVDIISTTVMIDQKLHLVLKLGENPRVNLKIEWPGSIHPTVQNATILEQHR